MSTADLRVSVSGKHCRVGAAVVGLKVEGFVDGNEVGV